MKTYNVTSEYVSWGHPDKTCDIIADAFLDEALRQDPQSQMAVECAIKNDHLFIYGESTTSAKIDYDKVANDTLKFIGYDCPFTIEKCISEQSPEIHEAVVGGDELAANDQGIVYGYATNETDDYLPTPLVVAKSLIVEYENCRRHFGFGDVFMPDAKSQVTIKYEGNTPKEIVSVVFSASHSPKVSVEELRTKILMKVVLPTLNRFGSWLATGHTTLHINPAGPFTVWGSFADSGCVGRKIVVDTYGGVGRVGGGCFSSKNPTKVDRSGAYYARYVAKKIVASKLAQKCEVQVAYGIGLANPIDVTIDCFGTNLCPLDALDEYVKNYCSFKVGDIIQNLNLLRPIYKNATLHGHFGDIDVPWERIEK